MIRRRLNYTYFYLRLTTMFLPTIAFSIAAYFRFCLEIIPRPFREIDAAPYFGLLLFATTVWAIASEHYGLCQVDQIFSTGGKTKRALLACAVTYLAILAATFFYRAASFSRLFTAISAVTLFALVIATRVAFRVLLDRRHRQATNCIRILIIGADHFADRVACSLLAGQVMPCTIVGFVRLPDQEVAVTSSPVHEMGDIPKLAIGNGIDDVILAVPPARLAEISAIMGKLEPLCVPVRAILDLGEGVFVREKLLDFCGALMLDLHTTPAESLMYSVLKRAFDIVFSLSTIILTAPILLLTVLIIKLTSPGPVLFIQERVGLNGRVFRMYKFRTMRVGEGHESDTRWTTENDPRRTRVGTFLRRMSLDELPQFLNVLKGDMSIVGPRPERPYFVQKFLQEMARYNTRHHLKVGITGWAQVNGWRGNTSIAKRVEYDLYYLRNWSLSFDLQIIILTLIRGLSNKNAY